MICAFDHGSLVKDVINKMKANNIDEKKLVQYCVLRGYLRRVRDYRISLDESTYMNNTDTNNPQPNGNTDGNDPAKTKLKKDLRVLCDGTNDSDSLACLGYIFNSRSLPTARKHSQQQTAPIDSYLTLWK